MTIQETHNIYKDQILLLTCHLWNCRIMGEIRDLVKNPSDGIRYVDNDENTVSEIHVVMDGPGEQHSQ